MRKIILLAGAMLLGGCDRDTSYPPPLQRQFGPPAAAVTFIEMDDFRAPAHIVREIRGNVEGAGWRWTNQRPELRFLLDRAGGWKVAIDFTLPESNFRDTGPVTLSFFVNDQLLDRIRFTTAGDKHFEKAVPPAWLRAGEFNVIKAEVSPPWVSPGDGAKLGVVLHRAGFVR